MNHDYFALKIHETRAADLQAEARQDSLVREVLRARRVIARLTAPTSVIPLRPRGHSGTAHEQGRDAA